MKLKFPIEYLNTFAIKLISISLSFGTILYLQKYYGPDIQGVFSVSFYFLQLLALAGLIGTSPLITKEAAEAVLSRSKFLKMGFVVCALSALVVIFFWVFITADYVSSILATAAIFLMSISLVLVSFLRGKGHGNYYVIIVDATKWFVVIISLVFLLEVFNFEISSRSVSIITIVVGLTQLIIASYVVKSKNLKFESFRSTNLRISDASVLPRFAFIPILTLAIQQIGVYQAFWYLGDTQAGEYNMAFRFAMVALIPVQLLAQTMGPQLIIKVSSYYAIKHRVFFSLTWSYIAFSIYLLLIILTSDYLSEWASIQPGMLIALVFALSPAIALTLLNAILVLNGKEIWSFWALLIGLGIGMVFVLAFKDEGLKVLVYAEFIMNTVSASIMFVAYKYILLPSKGPRAEEESKIRNQNIHNQL